jgi:tRNA(Ile)-lysidine synthase
MPSPRKQHAFDPVGKLLELTGPRPTVVVAYSGGLDSTVLVHQLAKQRRKLASLRLVHIDHGLQAMSKDWSRHCARQARTWRLTFVSVAARVKPARGESLEAAAREARYALLAKELAPGEVLVTAQHLDDQVETLLLQLFRGAGVPGLAAMPERAPFANGLIVRPMLGDSRAELERHAKHHRLEWVEDPSNQLERFGRNFLRHRILPLLRERWIGIDQSIARSARHMAEAAGLLEESVQRDLMATMDGNGLNVAALRRLRPARRRNILRAFIARAGLELPTTAQMIEMAGSLLVARSDAQPEVSWYGCTLQRRSGRLLLKVKSQQTPEPQRETALKTWHWKEHREFVLNGAGDQLALIDDTSGPVDLDKLPKALELRPRSGGEQLRPGSRARTQSLKKLMQAARLPVEERARLPLLFGEGPKGRLIAAGDRWLDVSALANVKSRRRARLVWKRNGVTPHLLEKGVTPP